MKYKFTFDEEAMENALRANGWTTLWHPNNWVYNPNENPDYVGVSFKKAFELLLLENNLVPRDMKDFWIEEYEVRNYI